MTERLIGMPEWFADWTKDQGGINVQGFAWILSRPKPVQELCVRFPPKCVVRVLTSCPCGMRPRSSAETNLSCATCAGTGRVTDYVGIVYSLVGGDTPFPTVKVVPEPGSTAGVEYSPDELEVCGFWNGVTHDVIRSILDVTTPAKLESTSVSRNTPCRCGSGKKTKKCCGELAPPQREALQ